MNFAVTVSGLLLKSYVFLSGLAGSVVEIEDSAVPEAAAAHCNVHWSILCIIAVYGIYAVLRASYIKRVLWSDEEVSDSVAALLKKSRICPTGYLLMFYSGCFKTGIHSHLWG